MNANKYLRDEVREITIFIHGVSSEGEGFDPVVNELREDPGFPERYHRLKIYNHGWTFPGSTVFEGSKRKLRDAIGGYIHKQYRKYPYIEQANVVAHSYGTYGICQYLKTVESDELTIDNLLLLGSVVDRDYPWGHVIDNKDMVNDVYNYVSSDDWVTFFGGLAGLGSSGDYALRSWFTNSWGFNNTFEGRVRNILVDGGHSWYQSEDGISRLRNHLLSIAEWAGKNPRE